MYISPAFSFAAASACAPASSQYGSERSVVSVSFSSPTSLVASMSRAARRTCSSAAPLFLSFVFNEFCWSILRWSSGTPFSPAHEFTSAATRSRFESSGATFLSCFFTIFAAATRLVPTYERSSSSPSTAWSPASTRRARRAARRAASPRTRRPCRSPPPAPCKGARRRRVERAVLEHRLEPLVVDVLVLPRGHHEGGETLAEFHHRSGRTE